MDLSPGVRVAPAQRAIAGTAPAEVARPESAADAAAIVAACARDGRALVPWGGGEALAHEIAAPPRYDLALDLGALDRILTYDPDDFTVTVECGIPLSTLRTALAAHGQELPIEAAGAAATLGGALATNAGGARRRAFGAPRDRILGARFVTGDGQLVRTGGRVVKNVAGHAVHRLLVGARGALGVFVEASLKLLPQPPARTLVVHAADAALLTDPARWAGLARLEPAALTVLGTDVAARVPGLATRAPFAVLTAFEGDPAWVDACIARVTERLGAPMASHHGRDVAALWDALAHAGEWPGPRLEFATAANTPAALAPLAGDAASTSLVFHAASGRLRLAPAPDAAALARRLAEGSFVLLASRGAAADVPAPPAAVRALRERISDALDPAGVMAYGARWRAGH